MKIFDAATVYSDVIGPKEPYSFIVDADSGNYKFLAFTNFQKPTIQADELLIEFSNSYSWC